MSLNMIDRFGCPDELYRDALDTDCPDVVLVNVFFFKFSTYLDDFSPL